MIIEKRTVRQLDPRTLSRVKSVVNTDDTDLVLRVKRGDEEVIFFFARWPWTGDLVVRLFVYRGDNYKDNAVICRPLLTLPLDILETALIQYQGELALWLASNLPGYAMMYYPN